MESKSWIQSKTIWAVIATELVCAAADNVGALQPLLPPDFFKWVAYGFPLACIALRKATSSPMHFAKPPE